MEEIDSGNEFNESDTKEVIFALISQIFVEHLKYYPERAYGAIKNLFMNTKSDNSHTEICELGELHARHDRWIWERYDPLMQAVYAEKNLQRTIQGKHYSDNN